MTRTPSRLTSLPAALRAKGYVPPDYRGLREKAVNGVFPACQINGIWHFYTDEVPTIAAAIGLTREAGHPVAA